MYAVSGTATGDIDLNVQNTTVVFDDGVNIHLIHLNGVNASFLFPNVVLYVECMVRWYARMASRDGRRARLRTRS